MNFLRGNFMDRSMLCYEATHVLVFTCAQLNLAAMDGTFQGMFWLVADHWLWEMRTMNIGKYYFLHKFYRFGDFTDIPWLPWGLLAKLVLQRAVKLHQVIPGWLLKYLSGWKLRWWTTCEIVFFTIYVFNIKSCLQNSNKVTGVIIVSIVTDGWTEQACWQSCVAGMR